MNLISISSARLAEFESDTPNRLFSMLKVMTRILRESVVDGFELLYKPEWDGDPALSKDSSNHTAEEVLSQLQLQHLPILSVHARKDLGNYLCSRRESDIEKGKGLVRNALAFTEDLGAEICTFHLWDTLESNFNPAFVQDLFEEAADTFPKLKASVENIPTSLSGKTPIALIKRYQHVTLDTRWAARYGELNAFEPMINRVANVHLRGALKGERWVLSDSGFHFYDTLHTITGKWGYRGMLTVEPDGEISSSQFSNFLKAMFSLRTKHVAGFD